MNGEARSPRDRPTSPSREAEGTAACRTPTDKPAVAPNPDRTLGDKIDAAAGVAQTAITVATWLGITGATGGTGV